MSCFTPQDLARWTGGAWDHAVTQPLIGGFSKDSRDIREGDCYIALEGDSHDGHRFIADAARKGASCALVRQSCSDSSGIALLRVEDTCKALQDIAAGYRAKVDPFVVGVSGSAGKTTAKEMIAACLGMQFKTACTTGNWNNHIGLPMSLLTMGADTQCAVMEVGMNHPGELMPLCRILRPDWAVITNVGPVHLENFNTVEDIAREKAVLLESVGSDGMVFLDADGKYFDLLQSRAACEVVKVSALKAADYSYSVTGSQTFVVTESATGDICNMSLTVPGAHIIYDAVLAAAVARRKGIDWGLIKAALADYKSLPMRWEVSEARGIAVINDAYNANPMSMRASIDAFMTQKYDGRRFLVLGDMLELGDAAEEEHRSLGRWLGGKGFSGVVAVGTFGSCLADAAREACDNSVCVAQARDVADVLMGELAAGDAVLFKGSRGIHLEVAAEDLMKKVLD